MRPRSSATAKKFAILASVRTVAPMLPVEFGAVSSVLIGIIVIRSTGPMGPMAESHSGERTLIRGGAIAENALTAEPKPRQLWLRACRLQHC
jgi:hypothetical protein